jgi:hypothetical protein
LFKYQATTVLVLVSSQAHKQTIKESQWLPCMDKWSVGLLEVAR